MNKLRTRLDIKVEHLPQHKGDLPDYYLAWYKGIQSDGVTKKDAVLNAKVAYKKKGGGI